MTLSVVSGWIAEGRYPGARVVEGMWHVPVSELVADGVRTDEIRPSNRSSDQFRVDALDGGVTAAPVTEDRRTI